MKSLLLKDFYTLTKQLKIFLLMIVIFSFIPGYQTSSFAIVYSSMLPVTALAYDERSKWDKLASMMPYSNRNLVLSKYVLGYISVIVATALTITANIIYSLLKHSPVDIKILIEILPVTCVALIIEAINLPFMFKMGVEKGRLIFMALITLTILGSFILQDKFVNLLSDLNVNLIYAIVYGIVITIIINVISIISSEKLYKTKEH